MINSLPNDTITEKAIRGASWSAISRFSCQGMHFIIIAILARLLTPHDFGIIGMAAIFTGLIGTLNGLGFSSAIIQREKLDEHHLSTSFWCVIVLSVVLCGITIIVSPFAARLFSNSIVSSVMIVSSFGFVIGSLGAVHLALLTRNLEFKKIAIIEIGITIITGVSYIALALCGFGVWSLVWGGLIGMFVEVILWWIMCDWRPLMRFSKEKFNDLFRFGANITGFSIVDYARENVDYLLVGKLLGASSLGLYTLAYNLVTYPQKKISSIIMRVAFSTFSRWQEDNKKIRHGYLKSVIAISLISFPLLVGLCSIAPEFVRVVYGAQWIPIILPLRILCVAGILYSIGTTTGSVILAKGRADLQLKIGIVCFLSLASFVWIGGRRFGMIGVATAISVYTLLAMFIVQAIVNKLIELRMKDYLHSLIPATLGSAIMAIVIVAVRYIEVYILNLSNLIVLLSLIPLGIMTYFVVLRFTQYETLQEIIILFRSFIKSSKQ